jgi:hypothetical protein
MQSQSRVEFLTIIVDFEADCNKIEPFAGYLSVLEFAPGILIASVSGAGPCVFIDNTLWMLSNHALAHYQTLEDYSSFPLTNFDWEEITDQPYDPDQGWDIQFFVSVVKRILKTREDMIWHSQSIDITDKMRQMGLQIESLDL